MKNLLLTTLALACANVSMPGSHAEETVRLCADSWMPYNGEPDASKPGYVIEFAREIFAAQGIQVEYQSKPWDDTLAAAREGTIDGAICANSEEGAGLVLPSEAVGAPKMIILTRKDSTWNYESVRSLKDIRLGVIAEYSYWEFLDGYIERSDAGAIYTAQGESPLDDLFSKLEAGEIDALIDSEAVIVWKLRQDGKTRDDYRAVYRHVPDPVFIAFAPTDNGRRFARIFDAGMKELIENGRAAEIAAGYGLRDWR